MTKEKLDSDRLNYLIWRYLVESDYRETAVKLQKEWNIEDPQQLPFAQHVNVNALVRVTNRGLLYDESEREEVSQSANAVAQVSGYFGPLTPDSPVADEELESARKRQNDDDSAAITASTTTNGPPNKKPRLSNGTIYENGFDTSAMDVDDEVNGDENAYPSPEQAETPAPIPLATTGPATGTQVDKVHELNSQTTFLDLSDDAARNANTVLLQCEFNPRDPNLLAAAGTDALARMWTLSRAGTAADAHDAASEPESPRKPKFAAHHNLLDESMPSSTTTTGLSWSSDGNTIVVSSETNDDDAAKVEFWNTDGIQLASFNTFESPIVCSKWNLDNSACITISPANDLASTVITVMHLSSSTQITYPLPNHSLKDQVLDVAWTANDVFVICGGEILRAYQVSDGGISPVKKFETREGHALSDIVFDVKSQLLATSSDTGIIDIWDANGHRHSFNAHQGLITALAWQPLSDDAMTDDNERLLASAGEDGAIGIWNARSTDTKSKYAMTMTSSVVSIKFTPDGAHLAGATNEQILIWKTDDVNLPRGSWSRNDNSGWRTPQTQDSSNDEDQFSLSWNASGEQLAYGVNSRLAIIHFQP